MLSLALQDTLEHKDAHDLRLMPEAVHQFSHHFIRISNLREYSSCVKLCSDRETSKSG